MTATVNPVTAEDLLKMPSGGSRYELIRGELRRTRPDGFRHGRITMNIATPLDQYVRSLRLGVVCTAETGFWMESN